MWKPLNPTLPIIIYWIMQIKRQVFLHKKLFENRYKIAKTLRYYLIPKEYWISRRQQDMEFTSVCVCVCVCVLMCVCERERQTETEQREKRKRKKTVDALVWYTFALKCNGVFRFLSILSISVESNIFALPFQYRLFKGLVGKVTAVETFHFIPAWPKEVKREQKNTNRLAAGAKKQVQILNRL
jgi:hypothetical protein